MNADQLAGNRTNLILVQPTPFCNIDCSYCYLHDRSTSQRMDPNAAEQMFSRLFALPTVRDRTTVVWHAGEPLAMPITAFEELLKAALHAKPEVLTVKFNIQTNATLIDQGWCELFKKYQIAIGVSVDGPKHINDRSRLTRSGGSTFDKTARGMALLKKNGIPFHVITVLTTHSLDDVEGMFAFYRDHGIDQIGFNVEEKEGPHKTSSMGTATALERYRAFLHQFIMLAKASSTPVEVRELEATLRSIEGWRADRAILNEQVTPFAIISMDVEGNISTFSPELLGAKHERYESFKIGNILRDSFDDLCASPNFQALWSEIRRGVEDCKATCRYFGICGGGAPSNKLFENGTFASTETYYCRYAMKVPADLILRMASEARAAGNPIALGSRSPSLARLVCD